MAADTTLRALVTRPRANACEIAIALRARGIAVLLEPMLTILPTPEPVSLVGVQAILLTSANGAEALAKASMERNLPVMAVGDATARAAKGLGFTDVASADGDVETLADLVIRRLDPTAGALLHAAGSTVAGDLAGRLGASDFEIRRAVLYRTETATSLTAETIAAFRAGTIDMVLFFSPRTAGTFVTLVQKAGISAACRRVDAFCLSRAVAEAAAAIDWRSLHCAIEPKQSALLSVIDAALGLVSKAGQLDRH